MMKTGKTVLRIVFIGVVAIFALAKLLEAHSGKNEGEKRIRHVDHMTSEFDELF